MIGEEKIRENLNNTVTKTDFPELGEKYQGKVRDNYTKKDKRIIIVTDRISAFDVVLGAIPFKGQVLNQLAQFWFEKTKDVAKSHFEKCPDPNVMIVKNCTPFPVEVIVRGYITGSLWREYSKGQDNYGIGLAQDLKKDQKLEKPILTPSTKADSGHDMPLKRADVIKLIPEDKYATMENFALALFKRGQEIAKERGLILVDTKYEFGETTDGEIVVIDEIHTPDSSRYWIENEYQTRYDNSQEQYMLDKEFIRQWLIQKGYMGDGPAIKLDDDIKIQAAIKYIELFERVTGEKFEIVEGNVLDRIKENLRNENGNV